MAKHVRTIDRALHVGAAECACRNLGHGFRAERAKRGGRGQEHVDAGHIRPVVFAIAEESLAHLLREGKTGLAAVLASHAQCAVMPVDIAPLQRGNIACTES